MKNKMSRVKINSAYFIISCVALVIFASVINFVPKETWTKLFSGRFSNFAAAFSSTPNLDVYVINGNVNAVVPDTSGGAYMGGDFTSFGGNVGRGVPFTVSTGLPVSTFPKVNNEIYAVIQDGSGGWYIGGAFTQVGTLTRNRLAHILSNGTVDTNFNPNLNAEIYAFALSTSTNTLYFGGQFGTVGGITRNHIASVDASTGSLNSFNPNAGTSGSVYSLALSRDGSALFLGGDFTTIGGVTYNHIGVVDTTSGVASTTFNPNINSGGAVYTILPSYSDSNTIYIGGSFTSVGGNARHNIAAINVIDGTASTTLPDDGGVGTTIFALALKSDESILYAGGSFTTFGSVFVNRNRLAAYDLVNATTTSFNPSVNQIISAMALTSDESTLYIGGQFTSIGGDTRNRFAAINTSTGSSTTSFNPNLDSYINALAFSPDQSILYAGGAFTTVGTTSYTRLVHILSNGTVDTNFSPSVTGGGVSALALSSSGSTLYLGGAFTTIGGVTYNRIAAVDATTGAASTTFNPNSNGTVSALALSGSTLYLGGSFTTVDAATRNRIAAVDTSTGSTTSFNPNVADGAVSALALSGSTLYLGGSFTTVDAATRNRIAAVNTSTGSTTSFNPNASAAVSALALSASTLYLGGSFTTLDGITRNRIAEVDTSTGSTTSFNPNASAAVSALALSGSTLYLGGSFTTLAGGATTRNRIAAVDISGVATAFNPNAGTTAVNALAISSSGSTLFMGGSFLLVGGVSQPRFATFPAGAVTGVTRNIYIISAPSDNPEVPNLYALTYLAGPNGSITGPSTQVIEGGTDGASVTAVSDPGYRFTNWSDGSILNPRTDINVANNISVLANFFTTVSTTTLTVLPVATTTPIFPKDFCFTKNLIPYTTNPDVKYLQMFLNIQGLNVTPNNQETDYYGLKTFNAVKFFQGMAPSVLPSTGNFGNFTRKKANDILGCATIFENLVPPPPKEIATTTPEIIASTTPPELIPPTPEVPVEPVVPTDILKNILENIRQSYEQTLSVLNSSLGNIGGIINSPVGSIVSKAISTLGIVLGAFVSLGAIAFATPITFSEIWFIPGRIFGLLMGALGIRKKTRPWGTVYDSVTKRPLDPAYVTLMDATTNKEIASAITDLDGRYGFLVLPGTYKIKAQKTNYTFPSQKMSSNLFDEVYNDLYFGTEIVVTIEGQTITKNIPMDSTSFDWNEFAKNKSNINTFIKAKDVTWARISKTIFAIGAVVSLIALIFAPRPYNLIIAICYIIAYIFNYFVFQVKKPGTLRDKTTNLPLSFAIVKIYREGMPADMPMVKKIADKYGKYYSLVPKGNYHLEIEKKNDDGSYSQAFKSSMVQIEKGIINEDLAV